MSKLKKIFSQELSIHAMTAFFIIYVIASCVVSYYLNEDIYLHDGDFIYEVLQAITMPGIMIAIPFFYVSLKASFLVGITTQVFLLYGLSALLYYVRLKLIPRIIKSL